MQPRESHPHTSIICREETRICFSWEPLVELTLNKIKLTHHDHFLQVNDPVGMLSCFCQPLEAVFEKAQTDGICSTEWRWFFWALSGFCTFGFWRLLCLCFCPPGRVAAWVVAGGIVLSAAAWNQSWTDCGLGFVSWIFCSVEFLSLVPGLPRYLGEVWSLAFFLGTLHWSPPEPIKTRTVGFGWPLFLIPYGAFSVGSLLFTQ